MKKLWDLILRKIPLKNYIIFESNPDFSDNTYWLFKYMAEKTDIFAKYKCVWFITDIGKKKTNYVVYL